MLLILESSKSKDYLDVGGGPRPEGARKICDVEGEAHHEAGSPYACVRGWINQVLARLGQHIYSGWFARSLEWECSSDYCKT